MRDVRRRIVVTGIVQGVGFRPFVWRRATRLGLSGWVANDSCGVVIELRGPAASVASFLSNLAADAPPLATVRHVTVDESPPGEESPPDPGGFSILDSTRLPGRPTPPPADIATCAACLAEVADPAGRRHGYAFTNCTDCGPRYTIMEDLPYDRATTTMRPFEMCVRCAAEYRDPLDRRFHAQPIACPECGPRLWFATTHAASAATEMPDAVKSHAEAIAAAQSVLRGGGIIAVKGIGGFHLCCDATSDKAVGLLRRRKQRPGKPFAVLVADAMTARKIARIDPDEERLLAGRDRPIVLLRRHCPDDGELAAGVSPGNAFVGVMLPCMPLHHLLCAGMPPLVMTSGNLAEEPIVTDNAAAIVRLGPLADGFLLHDRGIHVPCDDSVVRCMSGLAVPIRKGRGQAPLSIGLDADGPSVLAVGGELKVAVCVTSGAEAFMGQHIGDMGGVETCQTLSRTTDHLLRLLRIDPEAVVADMHPAHTSAAWAASFAAERGIPLIRVQHHEAHLAALLADCEASTAVGVCFDGTGYGHDGTIQGGEFIVTRGGGMWRAAHIEPFPLPGGDVAIRHPWRTALALLHAAGVAWDERLACVAAAGAGGRRLLARQLESHFNCVATSSMGRLFDAVAALAGLRQSVTYEAEAALAVESSAAAAAATDDEYAFVIREGDPVRVAWSDVVRRAAADAVAGVPATGIAARFQRGVATMIARVCGILRRRGGGGVAGLTGGVFQNAELVRLTVEALEREGFHVLLHRRVPPNDGGLALGQAVLGRAAVTAALR